jgi:penicillin-binding protein 2
MPPDSIHTQRRKTSVDAEHYEAIALGMRNAVQYGTCTGLYMPGIEVCGKTGTVENPQGEDHSACIAFAPVQDPKIAIAVYIQHGGFGATNAIPVARLMLEKFFYGQVREPLKLLERDIIHRVIQ